MLTQKLATVAAPESIFEDKSPSDGPGNHFTHGVV